MARFLRSSFEIFNVINKDKQISTQPILKAKITTIFDLSYIIKKIIKYLVR